MSTVDQIRLLTSSDLQTLLDSDAFDNDVDMIQARAFLSSENHKIVGAIKSGELIGFASGVILLHPDKQPMLFIAEVGVNEEYQRRGIGADLTNTLIQVARDVGCQGIWVATEADNSAARGLYRKLEANETNDIVVYDWDGAMEK
ncbi:MAG: GNAT family N-acetyltransferase [Hyphomicrobiaceae bacterium]